MSDFATRRTTMVDTQIRPSDVTKFPIIEAMLSTAREAYVPAALREAAYVGENLEIQPGRCLLEPRSLAKMLDALNIQPDEAVLDLGCALGYSSAVIAWLAGAVVAVEEDASLVEEAQATLSSQGVDNAAVIAGPLCEGARKYGPYDVICLQGGIEEFPAALVDQLKDNGRVGAIFLEGALGVMKIGHKHNGVMHWRAICNAAAPLLAGFAKNRVFTL